MLQIIGWLGCLYLIVKALEIAGSNVHKGEDGLLKPQSLVAVLLASVGALAFAAWFLIQGASIDRGVPPY